MNIQEAPSFTAANGERWKRAMVEHLCGLKFDFALTLSWNRSLPLAAATSDLRLIHGMVDQRLLGPRYHRKPKDQRTLAVFAYEGLGAGGHLHAHSLWRVRREHVWPFCRLFTGNRGGAWNDIVPSGSYALAVNSDPAASAGYLLKGQHMGSEPYEVVWSHEFLRA